MNDPYNLDGEDEYTYRNRRTMQINVLQQLTDFHGKPIETGAQVCPTCKRPIEAQALTLRDVLINALVNETEEEAKRGDGAAKFKRYKLARRIDANDEVQLSAEEVATLKERIAKFYTALIVGQVWDWIDPE